MPDNWESLPLRGTSIITARTGNIRTYIVGKIQLGEVRDETNGYLTWYIATHTLWQRDALPRGMRISM